MKTVNSLKVLEASFQKRAGINIFELETKTVNQIINDIAINGDTAVINYTQKFDHATLTPSTLFVRAADIAKARKKASPELVKALTVAYKNIYAYHKNQIPLNWTNNVGENSYVGIKYLPIERAGVYVPGGTAVYPSSVLMNVIPAQVAGVKEIILAVPPNTDGKVHPAILTAASIVGIKKILKVGGAQAIAAMALGTKKIPKVDIITGPGNIYVTLAKKLLFGAVGIDKLAGPSDSAIIADNTSNPNFVAHDILTQLEHDLLASSYLVTNSLALVKKVDTICAKLINESPRKDILKSAYQKGCKAVITKEFTAAANIIAPEHLHIVCQDAQKIANNIKHAGAIFIGEYSPEVLGDYIAGPNHVLPTERTSRFASPLMVTDFMKASSIIKYSKVDFKKVQNHIITLANEEGLFMHKKAAEIR